MRSPMNAGWVCIVLLHSSPSVFSQPEKPVSLSSEKQKLLKERDRLLSGLTFQFFAGKYDEGLNALKKALSLEELLYGTTKTDLPAYLQRAARLYEELKHIDMARKALKDAHSFQLQKYGQDHWQTQDAHRALKDFNVRQRLTSQQLRLLEQSDELDHRGTQLYRQGERQASHW